MDIENGPEIKNGPVGDYFYVDNVRLEAYQTVEYEGNYYFIGNSHKLAKDCSLYLSKEHVEGTGLPVGRYNFDAEGRMEILNGPVGDYFYLNHVRQNAYQTVEYEGNYYFIGNSHKLAKNCSLYLSEEHVAGTGLPAGRYNFDAEGRMDIKNVPEIKNGPVGDYFYVNNVRLEAYQVVEFEGNYYFIGDGHKLVKNRSGYLMDRYLYKFGLPAGTYRFDAEGKMILKNGPVDNRFYINGVQQNAYQLVQFEGNYYFIGDGNLLAMNCELYLSQAYVYGTGLEVGRYSFDSTGKMILD